MVIRNRPHLYERLISLNKQEKREVSHNTRVIEAKIRGGFRLTSLDTRMMLRQFPRMAWKGLSPLSKKAKKKVEYDEEKFWRELADSVDGSSYLAEFRPVLEENGLSPAEVSSIFYDLFLKPGHIFERKMSAGELPEKINVKELSPVYVKANGDNHRIESRMPFFYTQGRSSYTSFPGRFTGNCYLVEAEQSLSKEVMNNFKEQNNVTEVDPNLEFLLQN